MKLGVRLAKQRKIRDCCALILTETCLHHIPDQAVVLWQTTGLKQDRESVLLMLGANYQSRWTIFLPVVEL